MTVQDTTAPRLSGQGGPQTINCPATPVFTPPTASDICDPAPTITFSDATTPGACAGAYAITRTWKAKDACGNESAPLSQTITVQDITAPTVVSCPQDQTIDCGATPQFGQPVFHDDCDAAPTVAFKDALTTDQFGNTVSTRTWTATDHCGNFASCHQTITVTICGGSICVVKFYDKNGDGIQNFGEVAIAGWKFTVSGGPNNLARVGFTGVDGSFCFDTLPVGTYTVTEATPQQSSWINTTAKSYQVVLGTSTVTKKFGNVCLGAGGGGTPGFWSSKNGESLINDPPNGSQPELALLSSLCLRTAAGTDFDPKSYEDLKTWLHNPKEGNAAYILSVHLAAMQLNVESGKVDGNALLYAPGTRCANAQGFASVSCLMNEANQLLCKDGSGLIMSSNPDRPYALRLKDALASGNNNVGFFLATPCPFSF
ncbi:MAG: hypothetical protein DME25_11790 [Verrucomicrobia bacterium]|nr:MAG: hypothetical protein DME25_11790 [Verrucomicrobiota bacterium]